MHLKTRKIRLKICGISLLPLSLMGQTKPDTAVHQMKTVVVTRQVAATAVGLQGDGSLTWDMRALETLPRFLGNADPVHYARMLPGVQTNSEIDAGLHIQGSDNTHNLLTIQGVPVYNASHLLGIFSVFNASHYESLTLKRGANQASDPSRLGGTLTMNLPTAIPDSIRGEASLGLLSSQGTLLIPTGKRSGLILSGRGSYINLLYSRWLTLDDMSLRYAFGDVNATFVWQPAKGHRIWVDGYWGQDRTNIRQDEYQAALKLKWGNHTTALHWDYGRGDSLHLRSTLYNTRSYNRLHLSQADMLFRLPSDICDLGWRNLLEWKRWQVGSEAVWHNLLPQSPQADNVFNRNLSPQSRQHTQEYSLHANYTLPLPANFELAAGLRTSAYIDYTRKAHLAADPSLRVTFAPGSWQLSVDYALRHQYLFQTGTSAMGMPTEFWTSIGEMCPPQWGHNANFSACVYLADGRWRLSADIYYKRLYNQVEYDGDMMKFLNNDYRLADNLLHGKGHNYGVSIMATKRTGRVTGWVSYAYGRARRSFREDNYQSSFPASHERPHEINALVNWNINRHWTIAATYVFASGTPFTAPESFYITNGMLLAKYGPHNARRLKPYNRLDLSVNYLLPSRHLRQSGLNLSVYNATMQENDVTCRLKVHNGRFLYSHFSIFKYILPSISYFLKF